MTDGTMRLERFQIRDGHLELLHRTGRVLNSARLGPGTVAEVVLVSKVWWTVVSLSCMAMITWVFGSWFIPVGLLMVLFFVPFMVWAVPTEHWLVLRSPDGSSKRWLFRTDPTSAAFLSFLEAVMADLGPAE